jgi:hypothetical protein
MKKLMIAAMLVLAAACAKEDAPADAGATMDSAGMMADTTRTMMDSTMMADSTARMADSTMARDTAARM